MFPTVFPNNFPTDSRPCSRPISRLCSRPISRLCTRPISRHVPDQFHDPVRPKTRGLQPLPLNQMSSAFLSYSRPAVSKREPFPILSHGKTENKSKPFPSGTDRCLRYRAYPWFYLLCLQDGVLSILTTGYPCRSTHWRRHITSMMSEVYSRVHPGQIESTIHCYIW